MKPIAAVFYAISVLFFVTSSQAFGQERWNKVLTIIGKKVEVEPDSSGLYPKLPGEIAISHAAYVVSLADAFAPTCRFVLARSDVNDTRSFSGEIIPLGHYSNAPGLPNYPSGYLELSFLDFRNSAACYEAVYSGETLLGYKRHDTNRRDSIVTLQIQRNPNLKSLVNVKSMGGDIDLSCEAGYAENALLSPLSLYTDCKLPRNQIPGTTATATASKY